MPSSDAAQNGQPPAPQHDGDDNDNKEGDDDAPSGPNKQSHTETKTPEPKIDQHSPDSDTPSSPGQLGPFDWDDFEARYEKALREADAHERETLKEAEHLSKVKSSHAGSLLRSLVTHDPMLCRSISKRGRRPPRLTMMSGP